MKLIFLVVVSVVVSVAPFNERLAYSAELSFGDALKVAIGNSGQLKSAQLQVNGAKDTAQSKSNFFLPSIKGTISESMAKDLRSDNLPAMRRGNYSVDAQVNLYRFGADEAANERAMLDFRVAEDRLKLARLAEEAAASAKLLAYIRAVNLLVIQRKVAEAHKESLTLTKKLVAQGLRPRQDEQKQEIDAADDLGRIRRAEAEVATLRNALGLILGGAAVVASDWPFGDDCHIEHGLAQLASHSGDEHPELAIHRQTIELAKLDARISRKANYPVLDATASVGGVRGDGQSASEMASASLVLTVPIFDRFQVRDAVRGAVLRGEVAEAEFMDSARSLAGRRQLAQSQFASACKGLRENRRLLDAAEKIYHSSAASYARGLLSALELNQDFERVLRFERALSDGVYETNEQALATCSAQGYEFAKCQSFLAENSGT